MAQREPERPRRCPPPATGVTEDPSVRACSLLPTRRLHRHCLGRARKRADRGWVERKKQLVSPSLPSRASSCRARVPSHELLQLSSRLHELVKLPASTRLTLCTGATERELVLSPAVLARQWSRRDWGDEMATGELKAAAARDGRYLGVDMVEEAEEGG